MNDHLSWKKIGERDGACTLMTWPRGWYRPRWGRRILCASSHPRDADHAIAKFLHPNAFWRRGCALRGRGTPRLVGDVHTEYAESVAHLVHEICRHRVAITCDPELPVPQHAYDTRYSV